MEELETLKETLEKQKEEINEKVKENESNLRKAEMAVRQCSVNKISFMNQIYGLNRAVESIDAQMEAKESNA